MESIKNLTQYLFTGFMVEIKLTILIYFLVIYNIFVAMDNVLLGLSIAVAIVSILLLNCWKKDEKKSVVVKMVKVSPPQPSEPKSDSGTGVQNREFNNRYKQLSNAVAYEDYGEVAQYMSVEPEVYESHARYSEDMNQSTSGASMLPERDDPNDVVPWVGLRKPRYRDVYSGENVRQDHTETPDQMRNNSYYCVG